MHRLATSTVPRAAEQFQTLLPASICAFCQLAASSFQRQRRAPFSTSSQTGLPSGSTLVNLTRSNPSSIGSITARLRVQPARYASTRVSRSTEDYEAEDHFQAQEDARLYARQLRVEEKAAWQAQVDDAPMHQDYIPASTWDGLEMVGGEKEWNTGRQFNGYSLNYKGQVDCPY